MSDEGREVGDAAAGFEPAAEQAGLMADLARQLVEAVGERQRRVLDYSDPSIAIAEQAVVELVDGMKATGSGEELRHATWFRGVQLAAYFGETFIRNHGGSWVWANNPGVGRDLGLLSHNGCMGFPITKARKRLDAGGEWDSVVSLYRAMVRFREIFPEQRDSKG